MSIVAAARLLVKKAVPTVTFHHVRYLSAAKVPPGLIEIKCEIASMKQELSVLLSSQYGFTIEFVSRAWGVDETIVKKLVSSQPGNGVVKVDASLKMPQSRKGDREGFAFNCLEAPLDVDIKNGGRVVVLNTENLPMVGEVGFGALTGSNGIFTGFTTEFVSRAWGVDETIVKKLVSSQPGNGIVKVDASLKMPQSRKGDREGFAFNCLEAPLDVDIKNGGRVVVLNTENLPMVGEVGFGADLLRIDGHSMCSPGFVTYIVGGSGRVQIVGADGKRVLETVVKAGCLFIVPRFFLVSKIADSDTLAVSRARVSLSRSYTLGVSRAGVNTGCFLSRGYCSASASRSSLIEIKCEIASMKQELSVLRFSVRKMEMTMKYSGKRRLVKDKKAVVDTELASSLKSESEVVLALPKLKTGYTLNEWLSSGVGKLMFDASLTKFGRKHRLAERTMTCAIALDTAAGRIAGLVGRDVEKVNYTQTEAVMRVSEFFSKWFLIYGVPLMASAPFVSKILEYLMM